MAADGSITFSTALDNSQLEKDLKQAERDVESLRRKVEQTSAKRSGIEEQMERADRAIDATKAKMRELAEAGELTPSVAERFNAQLEKQYEAQDRLNEKWQKLNEQVETYEKQLEGAQGKATALGEELQGAYERAAQTKPIRSAIDSISASFESMASRVGSLFKRVFVFGAILSALHGMRTLMASALQQNAQYAASMAALKASVQGFAAGIANALAPAIVMAARIAISALTALAHVIDVIFGTSIEAAIRSAQASAAAAAALGKEADATKRLAKEQRAAAKSLMAFDELNQLTADTADETAGGIGGDDGGGGGIDPSAFDVSPISEKLAEITAILGGALLAVGAILAFSGINIPLGLTLMAMGALLLYATYRENWDELSGKVQKAITGLFVLTGMTLFVIGAVLAFSGVNVPLGIGLMAGGAALLVSAVALNWSSMSKQMKSAVTGVMGVLSGALIVLGTVLAFAGPATLPLGVGLMLIGAATMASAIAINWDSLPEQVQWVVSAIAAVVSVAFLAVGAILAFSGASVPLGIALIAAGAVGLVATAALNWDNIKQRFDEVLPYLELAVSGALLAIGGILCLSGANVPLGIGFLVAGAIGLVSTLSENWQYMPEQVQNALTAIGLIVGASLLVVGVILCVSGAALPIGLALIAAGAAALVTAASFNPDFMRDLVEGAWRSVKDYWDQNIAPYLTYEYFAGLARSMMNGLISALNAGLSSVGSFINWVSSGISWLLACFGISWNGQISMPQIPYLAQGAVIPPNQEFLAVLGDQRSGNNIEAPEELLRQIVREEAGTMMAQFMASMGGEQERDVVLKVGQTELARVTVRGMREMQATGELGGLDALSLAFV